MDDAAELAKWQTIFSGLVTLFTFCYVVINGLQLRAMRKALEQTRRSNAATEKSNEIAERSLELGRRAWLVITGIETRAYYPSPDFPKRGVVVTIKNVGGVPATEIEARFYIRLLESSEASPDQMAPVAGGLDKTVLGPGESVGAVEPLPEFSEGDEGRMRAKEAFLLVYCEVSYNDLFKKDRKSSAGWERTAGLADSWVHATKYNRME